MKYLSTYKVFESNDQIDIVGSISDIMQELVDDGFRCQLNGKEYGYLPITSLDDVLKMKERIYSGTSSYIRITKPAELVGTKYMKWDEVSSHVDQLISFMTENKFKMADREFSYEFKGVVCSNLIVDGYTEKNVLIKDVNKLIGMTLGYFDILFIKK